VDPNDCAHSDHCVLFNASDPDLSYSARRRRSGSQGGSLPSCALVDLNLFASTLAMERMDEGPAPATSPNFNNYPAASL